MCAVFKYLCFLLVLFTGRALDTNSDDVVRELPYCTQSVNALKSQRLVFVSTLDGQISALNLGDGGTEKWSISTGPGPMLSSSIHRLELTNNGQWVRMIPSLTGGLYKFNGESIEAVPVTADNLLRSSFRYSDDLVISGGKESRTYGVEVDTGNVLYECSMTGCDNLTENIEDEVSGDIVIVQRQTQTVRAVEPRSGIERWNFSVGQHDVKMSPMDSTNCHSNVDDEKEDSDVVLKVIVPEGLVCALNKNQGGQIVWSHKFNSPVVSAWRLDQGKLELLDLFGGTQDQTSDIGDDPIPNSPALYIGMHNKQLYIQESVKMQNKLQEAVDRYQHHLITDEHQYPRIPWHPVAVTSAVLGKARNDHSAVLQITDENSQITDDNGATTTAISVLYASEYVNGNGYYLYTTDECANREVCASAGSSSNITVVGDIQPARFPGIDDSGDDTPVQIIIVSLWFYWKEVFVISITAAVVINLIIQRRVFYIIHHTPTHIPLYRDRLNTSSRQSSGISVDSSSNSALSILQPNEGFISRYLTDFDPVHCLGKGGYGIVFEAKNKIDDCHYAIKRIPLPNRQESRERVMREVKALAKLDHQNIVRYFNAWLECPPPGWQEQQDKLWPVISSASAMSFSGDATTVDLTGHVTPETDAPNILTHRKVSNSVYNNMMWNINDITNTSVGFSFEQNDKDQSDSYIVFESHSKEDSNGDAVFYDKDEEENKNSDSVITVNNSSTRNSDKFTNSRNNNKVLKRPNSLEILMNDNNTLCSSRMYLYIQMQLCRKESLRDWLAENTQPRDFRKVLNMFEQIVHAVEYVHQQGLIHRDLKPSNIFFAPDGQIKVGDFGLVTAIAENTEQWTPGCNGDADPSAEACYKKHTAKVGTHLYMSPEQLSGMPYNYKVDIYSLGLVLFELLVPFSTQMERCQTLSDLRQNRFPTNFQQKYTQEHDLLRLMLSHNPDERPTTIGIRARPPLRQVQSDSSLDTRTAEHFELPFHRRNSSISKSNSVSCSFDS